MFAQKVFSGHNIRAFVRDQKKLQKMVSKLKLDEVKLKKLEVIECDIFDSNTLNLSNIDLVVSCLGFHRRNNKSMKIDHYSRLEFWGFIWIRAHVPCTMGHRLQSNLISINFLDQWSRFWKRSMNIMLEELSQWVRGIAKLEEIVLKAVLDAWQLSFFGIWLGTYF